MSCKKLPNKDSKIHDACFRFDHTKTIGRTKEKEFLTESGIKTLTQSFYHFCMLGLSSVSSLSHVQLFATSWIAAHQASLSITSSQRLLKFMSIELLIVSNRLVLDCPLLLPPSIFPGIRVFSNESLFHIRWQKYWSFSFSISPSNDYSGLISFRLTG